MKDLVSRIINAQLCLIMLDFARFYRGFVRSGFSPVGKKAVFCARYDLISCIVNHIQYTLNHQSINHILYKLRCCARFPLRRCMLNKLIKFEAMFSTIEIIKTLHRNYRCRHRIIKEKHGDL